MADVNGEHDAALRSGGQGASLSWRKRCGQYPLQSRLWAIKECELATKGTCSREQPGTKNQV